MPRRIDYLVLHHNGVDGRTWRDILRTHLGNGWAGIGYHAVVHENGSVHPGRDEARPGAHTSGFNRNTLALCMIGNMNKRAPYPVQWNAAVLVFATWCLQYHLDPYTCILGHRETKPFVPKVLRTKKNCPGSFVDMDKFRRDVDALIYKRPFNG